MPARTMTRASASRKPASSAPSKTHAIPNGANKRKRSAAVKVQTDPNELPHGLGRIFTTSHVKVEDAKNDVDPPTKKIKNDETYTTKEDVKGVVSATKTTTPSKVVKVAPSKKSRTKRTNKYGVIIGETPYPDHLPPTVDQAREVNDILSKAHGFYVQPKEIPLPSLTVAGCGEVPCILDALIRTLLSAHTTNGNAGLAVAGIVEKFGVLESGLSKGSINWNAVRQASYDEILGAIASGGMGPSKTKNIQKILNFVYEENQVHRAEIANRAAKPSEEDVKVEDDKATAIDKAAALMLADSDALTLDYVHGMSAVEAFDKFIALPGIGVKTASCTILFCMQRPSFAVDTHVYRMCQWLGWVPNDRKPSRDNTFAHCDVRIPDELKYSLHQLLIRHGKQCGRCRAITGETSARWNDVCVLEHLLTRTGVRKGGVDIEKKGKKKAKKSMEEIDSDNDPEMVDDMVESRVSPKAKKGKASPKKAARKVKEAVAPKPKRAPRKTAVRKSLKESDNEESNDEDSVFSSPPSDMED